MVPMRDQVRLATDIYLPENAGSSHARLPVILTRTPYGKNGAKKQGEYFAAHGYVYHVRLHDDRPALLLDLPPGLAEPVLKHLDHFLISEQVEMGVAIRMAILDALARGMA